MKAVVFHEHGGVEKLKFEDVPDPEPGPLDVLVCVRACALNHLDLFARKGPPGRNIPLPHISGSDIAGEIVKTGDIVTDVRASAEVLVSPGISCGKCSFCLTGRESMCRNYQMIGYDRDGGYAEYVAVPASNLLPKPKGLSFEEASSVPLVFLTAWHMLVTRAHLQIGEEVLVIAAGSGVGTAAIQVAKIFGARVIAVAGTDEKLRKARELGADEVINHSTSDVVSEVKRLTGKRGVDVVVEHVGTTMWDKSILSLAPGGRLVTCGATSGYQGATDIRYIFSKQLNILGSYMGGKAELLEVMKFIENGKLKPVLDSVFPLKEAAAAQTRMEERQNFGKIVLKP